MNLCFVAKLDALNEQLVAFDLENQRLQKELVGLQERNNHRLEHNRIRDYDQGVVATQHRLTLLTRACVYSGPSLEGHPLERTPLQKGHT